MPVALGWTADRALTALLDALDEAALIFDERQVCRAAGRRAAELLGVDIRGLIGQPRRLLVDQIAAASAAPEAVQALQDEALSQASTVADPIELLRPSPRTLVWTSIAIHDPAGAVGRIDVLRDVTRERRAEESSAEMARRLEEASTVDELTGLANLRRFDEEAQREHRRSQRAWASYALCRVDIDEMAAINESRGERAGDELLRCVAEELRAGRREYDLVARGPEDEFLLLLPGVDGASARTVLKRAIDAIHERGRALVGAMTVSAGVAVWVPPSGESTADLVDRAGAALARARARGPGHLEVDVAAGEWKGGDEPAE
ncbi:MAG: diguanylate cyclase [Byssovorax sp.]